MTSPPAFGTRADLYLEQYRIALPELQKAVEEYKNEAVIEELDILVEDRRLRDISDLPLDLAI